MSDKKIVIPDGMLIASWERVADKMRERIECDCGDRVAVLHVARISVEAALLWMIENWGTAPNHQRMPDAWYFSSKAKYEKFRTQWNSDRDIPFVDMLIFFVNRYHESLLEPEVKVPKVILDLISRSEIDEYHPREREKVENMVLEAYQFGKNSIHEK